ncbi:hypothetical protein PLANPX_0352 [Lacipirellula parvula]|uniref:Uncharacterized protein n=1 Tax=Lacipirellula parvula TaxID=2650471 RepID=A0A5K7X2P7_9BACT|nr:hypothetical protein PLANPX_0352 [Lacipirellula parvula]
MNGRPFRWLVEHRLLHKFGDGAHLLVAAFSLTFALLAT